MGNALRFALLFMINIATTYSNSHSLYNLSAGHLFQNSSTFATFITDTTQQASLNFPATVTTTIVPHSSTLKDITAKSLAISFNQTSHPSQNVPITSSFPGLAMAASKIASQNPLNQTFNGILPQGRNLSFPLASGTGFNNHTTQQNTSIPHNATLVTGDSSSFVQCFTTYEAPFFEYDVPMTSPSPFESYWCNSWIHQRFRGNPMTSERMFYAMDPETKSICLSIEAANFSSFYATQNASATWTPVITSPCCNSDCTIQPASAQLFYWPTPAPYPNITTLVGTDGFTYTSPSVYAVYYGITAAGDCGQVGGSIASVTISYAPQSLLAWDLIQNNQLGVIDISPQTIDYAALAPNCSTRTGYMFPGFVYCPSTVSGLPDPACLRTQSSMYSSERSLGLHCYPQLIFPPQIQTMDPAWATCNKLSGLPQNGVYDPPHALRPAGALVTTKLGNPQPQVTAEPASQILNPAAPITSPPSRPSPIDPTSDPSSGGSKDSNAPTDSKAIDSGPKPSPVDAGSGNGNDPGNAASQANNEKPGSSPVAQDPSNDESPSEDNSSSGEDPPPDNGSPSRHGSLPNNDPLSDPASGNKPSQEIYIASSPIVDPAPANTFAVTLTNGDTLPGIVINPTAVQIGNSKVIPGASAVTISGHRVSIDPAASKVFIDSQSQFLPNQGPQSAIPTEAVAAGLDYAIATTPVHSLVVGSITLTPNGPAATLSGTPISLGSSAFVVGSSTVAFAGHAASDRAFATTLDGHLIQAVPSSPGVVVVDGQHVTAGAEPSSVHGMPIVLKTNGDVIIGSSTISNFVPALSPASYFTVGSETLTLTNGQLQASQTTLVPGDSGVNIDGTLVSLGSTALRVGTSTIPILSPASYFTVGGETLTLTNGQLQASQITLVPGDSGIKIDGTLVSLGSTALRVGASTIPILAPTTALQNSVITAAGQIITLLPKGVEIAGVIISSNAPATTIAGTRLSLGINGLVVGQSTVALTLPSPLISPLSSTITTLGQTFTIVPEGLVDSGTTIRLGDPPVTISGTQIGLQSNGIVIGSSTIPYPKVEQALTQKVGDWILDELNRGLATATATPSQAETFIQNTTNSPDEPVSFEGYADRIRCHYNGLVLAATVFWLVLL